MKGVLVRLDRNPPAKNLMVHFYHRMEKLPEELERAVVDLGYEPDDFPPPPMPNSQGYYETIFHRPGTDLFGSWGPREATKFSQQIRGRLRILGYSNVPVHELTLAELL